MAAATTAAMTRGDVQPRTTPWDTANTMRAMALVISRAPRTSRRWVLLVVFAAVPRMAGARAAAARPTGTLTRNTARQLVNSTSTPPRTWPATKPTEEIAPYRPMARVRSAPSGKLVVMRDSAAGATIAAPAPWMTRAAISSAESWARPPARLASANAMSPITNIRRRPSRSAARPPRMSRPPNEMAYPVTIHCTASGGMCSSRSIEGSATFTMLKSRTTMNAATRMRASCRGRRVPCGGWVCGVFGCAVFGCAVFGCAVFGCARVEGVAVRVSEGAVPGMIPIRYVTDRFRFPESRTGR